MSENQNIDVAKSERLKQVRTALGISQTTLANLLGTHQANVGKMENAKRPIGKNFEYKIVNELGLRGEWWDSGVEPMFQPKDISTATALPSGNPEDFDLIVKVDSTEFRKFGEDHFLIVTPLISQYAYAGYVAGWSDPEYVDTLPRHVVIMKEITPGIYRSFTVRGDSMDNGMRASFADGDIVCGRLLNQKYWTSKFHLHKYKNYVLVTNDGILIKQISEHRVEEGVVVCHSLNEDKEVYPDFEVNLKDVKEIYYIKARTEPLL